MTIKHCFFFYLLLTSAVAWGQRKAGNFVLPEGTPLTLTRYGHDLSRQIKQGVFLKVYQYDDSRVPTEIQGKRTLSSVVTGKIMFKGQFFKVSGDTLVLVHRGNPVYVDVDKIVMIKQFYSPFRRIVGSAINGFGLYGMALGGGLAIAGVITMAEGEEGNGFGPVFFFSGLVVGGASFLIHRLGLLFRRNKYDLTELWYINRNTLEGP